jgi:hypothetical protein
MSRIHTQIGALVLLALSLCGGSRQSLAATDLVTLEEKELIEAMDRTQLEAYVSSKADWLAEKALELQLAPEYSFGRQKTREIIARESKIITAEVLAACKTLDWHLKSERLKTKSTVKRAFLPTLMIGAAFLVPYVSQWLLPELNEASRVGLTVFSSGYVGLMANAFIDNTVSHLPTSFELFLKQFKKGLKERGLKLNPVVRREIDDSLYDFQLGDPTEKRVYLFDLKTRRSIEKEVCELLLSAPVEPIQALKKIE